MTLEQIVRNNFASVCDGSSSVVYFDPDIPEKKIKNAISSYANEINQGNVIALHDSTVFGGAKEGCLVTCAGLYMKGFLDRSIAINFNDLTAVEIYPIADKVCLKFTFENGKQKTIEPIESINFVELYNFFEKILELKKTGGVDETDKLVIVQDMPNEVKINYLKTIINMVFEDDGVIDDKELAEMQTLMAQLDFEPELRNEVRLYISEPNTKTNTILKEMDGKIPKGSEEALHMSLIKDLVRVHRATKGDSSFKNNKSLLDISNKYKISNDQIEVLENACKYDELIRDGKVDDNMIAKNAKNLASQAGAVGVPIAAIYLSGSVVGLSAAGITSGLAALGLGGILGFSSMVTGIGILIIAGVGTYKGIQWITGGKRKEDKTKKREFMIQEIIRINQTTICNLSKDINYFGLKIVDLTKESKIDKKMIEKLGKEMTIFGKAIDVLQAKGVNLEEVLYGTK